MSHIPSLFCLSKCHKTNNNTGETMKVYTETGHYQTSTQKLFTFLSEAQNLPKWATVFCKSIEAQKDGYYTVSTTRDEKLLFKIEANEATGTIDMYMGPTAEMLWKISSRVISDNMGGSIYTFTLIQMPNQPDLEFEQGCQGVIAELKGIQSLVE